MQNKLKTLKDIEISLDELFDLNTQSKIHLHIHKDRLKIRAEAINHITDLKSKIKRFEDSLGDENTDISLNMIRIFKGQIEWIKYFF